MRKIFSLLLLTIISAGCNPGPQPLPTVSSIEMAQTAVVLTQNAPPPGFERVVAYPTLDGKLVKQPSWHAAVELSFDGLDDTNKQKSTAELHAEIFSDELNSTRRVVFSASGNAFGVLEDRSIEAVRISNDYFWVVQNPRVCATVTDASRRRIADLTAAELIGGIKSAAPTGQRMTINGLPVWEYTFGQNDLLLPIIHTEGVGKYTTAAGSLWIAPSIDAVVRLTLTINVENVTLLEGDVPVTGQLRIVYEVKDAGTPYNITVPFGC